MNNKIPPPIITLTFGLAIYFSRPLFPDLSSGIFDAIGLIFLIKWYQNINRKSKWFSWFSIPSNNLIN